MRSGRLSADILRRQPPLPETADELCAVGRALGLEGESLDKAIFLGARATVSQVKTFSKSGELAKAKIIHFATHGLLASDTALFENKAEPALLMTPSLDPGGDDTGLLTASDVAQLSIDADWVVLSACNTAAGQSEDAEALSGLARAFFYAGARSLLVSHWPVDSTATVAITTGTVNAMKAAGLRPCAVPSLRSLAAAAKTLTQVFGRRSCSSVMAGFEEEDGVFRVVQKGCPRSKNDLSAKGAPLDRRDATTSAPPLRRDVLVTNGMVRKRLPRRARCRPKRSI